LKAKSREKLKPCKTINVSKVCALHTWSSSSKSN
jgi:hypothetical protein